MRRWAPWLLLAVVLAGALVIGSRSGGGERGTVEARTEGITREVRCPTCRNLSAAESDAPVARALVEEVRDRVEAGQTDEQIRGYLVSVYGGDILLRPKGTGVAGLVWALPVAAVVIGLGGLAFAFRRWKPGRWTPVSGEPT